MQVLGGEAHVARDDTDKIVHLTDAQWTIFEQYTIVRAVNPRGAQADLGREKLRAMLGGPEVEGDEKNPVARNTQFELYVGAVLSLGGVSLDLAEPDLTFHYLGRMTGIAAKRVRSPAQLAKRVKDAVKQVQSAGMPGFVAVNVDRLIADTETKLPVEAVLDERLPAVQIVDSYLHEHQEIRGSLVFGREARWDFTREPPKLGLGHYQRVRILPATQQEKCDGDAFWREVLARIRENFDRIWKRAA